MRTIIKLVILGTIGLLVYNYLTENGISIKDKVSELAVLAEDFFDEGNTNSSSSGAVTGDNDRSGYNTTPDWAQVPAGNTGEVVSDINDTDAEEDNYPDDSFESVTRYESGTVLNSTGGSSRPAVVSSDLPSGNTEWVKEVTRRYSPESWHMLMLYENLPSFAEGRTTGGSVSSTQKSTATFHYLRGNDKTSLIASMSTNVHEIAHGFYRQNVYKYATDNRLLLNWDNAEGYIYVSTSEAFFVSFPKSALFPSQKLVNVIPGNLRTFRFDTYIDGNTSTQSEGVFGLLNELHAYYLGSRLSYDMLEAYRILEDSDAAALTEWVSQTQSEMSAFWEFDFFIKEYLLYMKVNHPSDYRLLSSYKPFWEAYRVVRGKYAVLIGNYERRIADEIARLNSSGEAEVTLKDGTLWVRNNNSMQRSGTPIFSEERRILEPMLKGNRYGELFGDFPGVF